MSKEKQNKEDSWKDYEVGGIWDNGKYLYIQLDLGDGKMVLKAFKNKWKQEGSKHPDYKLYKDLPENRPQPPKKRKGESEESDPADDLFQ